MEVNLEATVKGSIVIAHREYIRKEHGDAALTAIETAMTPQDREATGEHVLTSSLVRTAAAVSFIETAERLYGDGSYALSRQMGIFSAHRNVSTVYKIFIRFGNPAFVLARGASFWRQVHSHGRAEAECTGPRSSVTRIYDFPIPSLAFCASLAGFFVGTLELCGCKEIDVWESECIANGGKRCEFPATWA
jgi:hypothetical protein